MMELDTIRARIDELDEKIIALWKERMALCAEAARVKARAGKATLQAGAFTRCTSFSHSPTSPRTSGAVPWV